MCYWVGTRKVRKTLLEEHQKDIQYEIPQLYYNTYEDPKTKIQAPEFQEHPVAIGKGEPLLTTIVNDDGKLKFKNLKWTLRWTWFDKKSQQTKEGRPLLNSMCENVFWQHKELIYSNRLVLPINGYWEFRHDKGKTHPHYIYHSEGDLLYLGGIWNEMIDTNTGEIVETFSIISTPPNKTAKILHNNPKAPNGSRMLLIMDKEKVSNFLDPNLSKDKLKTQFFLPYPDENIKHHETVRFLTREFHHYQFLDEVANKII